MALRDILAIYEKRRNDLIDLLESSPHLDPGKQHQIYGAIIEIETFIKTIRHYLQKEDEELKFRLKK